MTAPANQNADLKVGDTIKFRAATRWSAAAAVRKINGFDSAGRPTVRYGGWADFVVRPDEVLSVVNGGAGEMTTVTLKLPRAFIRDCIECGCDVGQYDNGLDAAPTGLARSARALLRRLAEARI